MGNRRVACPHNRGCTKNGTRGRRLDMFPYENERNPMKKAMKTTEAKKLYRFQRQTVESVLAVIKTNKGLTAFLTSGVKSLRTEFPPVGTVET
ncbi:MAG: transposase [Dissulfurispiraceae bacterium]|jgi:hypothetical protein